MKSRIITFEKKFTEEDIKLAKSKTPKYEWKELAMIIHNWKRS